MVMIVDNELMANFILLKIYDYGIKYNMDWLGAYHVALSSMT